jgi:hypothetical protein
MDTVLKGRSIYEFIYSPGDFNSDLFREGKKFSPFQEEVVIVMEAEGKDEVGPRKVRITV